ncbi:UNVERIFIED_CONTAM: hypothetical protein NO986_06700 [Comamonas sp. A-3]|uniref:hypothetical protein n=1 Tax=Comamonas TaxID=283 RepID=UPI0014950A31|nr:MULTISPECIES: hypothetical protein [Comamonas]MBL5977383.1 hypothetical protein [Comamonas sp. NyZ500]
MFFSQMKMSLCCLSLNSLTVGGNFILEMLSPATRALAQAQHRPFPLGTNLSANTLSGLTPEIKKACLSTGLLAFKQLLAYASN